MRTACCSGFGGFSSVSRAPRTSGGAASICRARASRDVPRRGTPGGYHISPTSSRAKRTPTSASARDGGRAASPGRWRSPRFTPTPIRSRRAARTPRCARPRLVTSWRCESGSCRTRRCGWRAILRGRCSNSSRAPTRPRPTAAGGIAPGSSGRSQPWHQDALPAPCRSNGLPIERLRGQRQLQAQDEGRSWGMAEKGKGRSLKDRLVDMGVLVEKDESPSAAQGSAAVSGPGGLPGPGSVAGGVDRDLLKQLLAAATKDTNDYTEFMLSADAMSGVIPDEATRIKAAFVASKPHGLTLERILAGLASSKRVLEAKGGEFERVLSQKVDALVTSKKKQLTQLQAEITALEQAEAKSRSEITAGQTQIEAAKANFLAAYNAAITVLSSNEAKLKTQLKG